MRTLTMLGGLLLLSMTSANAISFTFHSLSGDAATGSLSITQESYDQRAGPTLSAGNENMSFTLAYPGLPWIDVSNTPIPFTLSEDGAIAFVSGILNRVGSPLLSVVFSTALDGVTTWTANDSRINSGGTGVWLRSDLQVVPPVPDIGSTALLLVFALGVVHGVKRKVGINAGW